ncbi:MAG: hypothetical protein J2P39_00770 [Candidatus Dormibacteraeota bacterium]|nr:hypothetical protein [Candidatus Dormibacteraeota bacterium]
MHAVASVPDQVRAACAWVAGRARSVTLDEPAIRRYVATLPAKAEVSGLDPATHALEGDREQVAGFVLCLDAINFGSGWWPTIRKRPGLSGYFTMAAGLTERFRSAGAWSPAELARLRATDVAGTLDQDPDHPLMAQYAASLRDVGAHVDEEHGGSFAAVVDAANGSAVALAGELAGWDAFADVSSYGGRDVPFFKRAQLTVADLDRAGVARFPDEDRLTLFADNLVPHVLRVDGVLRLDGDLARAVDAGELLAHGSAEEVELRACAVHAVELLSDATRRKLQPVDLDYVLWNRGQEPRYKALPRPRSRTTAY